MNYDLTIGEVKLVGGLGGPEAQCVDGGVLVAGDGIVVRHGEDGLSVLPAVQLHIAVKLNWNGEFWTWQLPAVPKPQPVIRLLTLECKG